MHSSYHQTKGIKSNSLKRSYKSLMTVLALLVNIIAMKAAVASLQNFSAFDFSTLDSKEDIKKIVNFLTSDIADQGITYKGTAGQLNGRKLPLSYYCTTSFWTDYVLKEEPNAKTEPYISGNPNDEVANNPNDEKAAETTLQLERVNVHSGCNIYDAATWQIALALAGNDGIKGVDDGIKGVDGEEDLFSLADNQSLLLKLGYDGNDSGTHVDSQKKLIFPMGANRRLSFNEQAGEPFKYNGCMITDPSEAYFFRQVPRTFSIEDPIFNDLETKSVSVRNPYPKICVSWQDWKPITGENVWAFLIGPLQKALIQYHAQACVPIIDPAVQNALAILPTFQKMQSRIGAIYFAPEGSMQNADGTSLSKYTVSVENNMSALAGLLLLRKVLQQELAQSGSSFYNSTNQNKIKSNLAIIKTMLDGGPYLLNEHGTQIARNTDGLLNFLKKKAWNPKTNEFILGGEANNPEYKKPIYKNKPGYEDPDWVTAKDHLNDAEPSKAVDVNTWGIAVLGQPFIDNINGDDFGRSYKIWQQVKRWGGYWGPDRELWGVGYSDLDGNGCNGSAINTDDGTCVANNHNGVLSGEWTAGAINMVRALITQYREVANSTEDPLKRKNANEYVAKLQKDHDMMVKHIQSLRTDKYADEDAFASVRPLNLNYKDLISIPSNISMGKPGYPGKLGYLYASKRYHIPFGWNANPIPSMASTTWAVMLHYNFNPFSVNGDYSANPISDSQPSK